MDRSDDNFSLRQDGAVPPRLSQHAETSGVPPPVLRASPYRESQDNSWLKRALMPLGAFGLLLWKFKAFALVALKFLPVLLKTGGSMLLMIWVYALNGGWKFAVGFVLLIFVHECGHLISARRLGLKVGAPVFIPFFGAIIALKEAPRNAWIEAQVAIGGPLLGTVGALGCLVLGEAVGDRTYIGLAYVGFALNLFNLAPIGFLDGGRVVTALSPWLWLVGAAVMVALLINHFNPFLLLIFILCLPRVLSLFRRKSAEEARYFEVTPTQRLIIGALYFGLAAFLSFSMHTTRIPPGGL